MSNSNILFLDGTNKIDVQRWIRIWGETKDRRPHDHPAFLALMKETFQEPLSAFYKDAMGNEILYPFYKRQLNKFTPFKNSKTRFWDIISPYGYGGPLFEGLSSHIENASKEFEKNFTQHIQDTGCVSEFIREDIFQSKLAIRTQGSHQFQQDNVIIQLGKTADDHWKTYNRKVRKNVTRAINSGLKVVFDYNGDMIDDFLAIYYKTMERNQASEKFFISKERFVAFNQALSPYRGFVYVNVLKDDKTISTELILLSSDTMYSFLGGTLEEYFPLRPNDFLKHESIIWGGEKGYKNFVLGGGFSPNDGIFKYKQCFDPGNTLPYFVRKIIHNRDANEQLMTYRKNFEKINGFNWIPQKDFFPSYLA